MHRIRWGTVTLLASLTTAATVACDDPGRMPREWAPLALAEGERCPAVAGRYVDSSEPIARMLAGRFVPRDSVDADWDYFELAGSADTALHITVQYADGETRTGRAQKGSPYGWDYYCEDGWLKVGDRNFPDTWDASIMAPGRRPQRHAMRIAPGGGGLVARLDGITYDEFTVWCGDGCKGIPLPWTWETRSSWSRAAQWDPDAPSSRVAVRVRESERRQAELERAQRDPVYQEEQALENGPVVPGQETMRKRALTALVPGMLLRAVAPRDSGWHLSLEFEELSQLEQFMTRLSQSGPVAEIRVAPLYRAKTTNGHWIDVVWIRFDREPQATTSQPRGW